VPEQATHYPTVGDKTDWGTLRKADKMHGTPFAMPWLPMNSKSKLRTRRHFGVTLLGTGWGIMGLRERNKVLMIDTKVLFYTYSDYLGHLTWN